ncbi:HIT family protein [Amycolatopsis keratiniphila]|uniref:HIT family protein n=1 Tax=Amycolatopsis keratiniphila TaxID=129921 RepID=UPI0009FB1213|nr:HIT family protein [Amycolatopsis keratiniphila]
MTSERLRFCPFCPAAPGDDPAEVDPAAIVQRWPEATAFYPRRRAIPGHVIVAPHAHVESGHRDPLVTGYAAACAAELAAQLGYREYNLIQSSGRCATQTVPHLHWHLVPRSPDDGLPLPWTPHQQRERAEVPA